MAKKIDMKKVVWGAKLPNGKEIGGGNLDILNKKSVKKFIKSKKHKHIWETYDPECPSCGYFEECCVEKNCTTCRDGKTKEIVCD